MKIYFKKYFYWFLSVVLIIGFVCVVAGIELGAAKKHDFTGKCQLCHSQIPQEETPYSQMAFTGEVDELCSSCHTLDHRSSHPVGVIPAIAIPLQKYLDGQGRLSCVTCHDVHKEDKENISRQDAKHLLRGHTRGRAFCFLCHNDELLGMNWRHNLVVTYAHSPGELAQQESGALLDKTSIECLGCHDGTVSKSAGAKIKSGNFTHGIGLSHPIGVEYPSVSSGKRSFVAKGRLPRNVILFDGKLGCLSCHDPYGKEKNSLVMSNHRSALCLSCHQK